MPAKEKLKKKYGQEGFYDSDRHDYMTPLPEVIKPLLKFIGIKQFDVDVCCSEKNIPAKKHFIHGTFDGLKEIWKGICWMNPPFATMKDWVEQAFFFASVRGVAEVWCIFPARTETVFWQRYIANNPDCFVVFLKKDLSFIDPATGDYVKIKTKRTLGGKSFFELKNGKYKNPLAIVYFGKNAEKLSKRWNKEMPMPYKAWRVVE